MTIEDEIKTAFVDAKAKGLDLLPLAKRFVAFTPAERGPGKVTPDQWNRIAHEIAGVAYKPKPKKTAPLEGPGTEQKKLLTALDITEWRGCPCESLKKQMNAWGVEGCQKHLYEIAGKLRDNARKVPRQKKWRAAWLTLRSGLAWRLFPFPYVGLVRESIRRASVSSESTADPRRSACRAER